MSASTNGPGPTSGPFASYIEELQEFFASSCLRYGTPEDILDLTERIDSSPAFAEDLSSMVRSIVLREGGGLPHSQLLEILAVSVGGPRMDHAAQQFSQPLRYLLSFISGVLRKPWNEPPGDAHRSWAAPTTHPANYPVRHQAEIVPFPVRPRQPNERFGSQAAGISAAADRAAHENLPEDEDGDDRFDHSEDDFDAAEETFAEADEVYADEGEVESDELEPELRPELVVASAERSDPLSDPRFERRVPDLVGDPTPAEGSALDPENPAHEAIDDPDLPGSSDDLRPAAVAADSAVTPTWQLAAQAVRSGAVDAAAAAADSPPAAAAPQPVPTASKPVRLEPAAHAPASAFEPIHRQSMAPPFARSGANSASALKEKMPHLDALGPSFTPRIPRSPAGILVAGAAMLVVTGIVAASLNRTTELVGKQAKPAQTAPAPAATMASSTASTAQHSLAQRASAATIPRARRVSARDQDDDESDVAPPYSTPIPGQEQAAKPSPYIPSTQPAPVVHSPRPPSNEVATTGPIPGSATEGPGHEYAGQSYAGSSPAIHSYRDPDSAIVGDFRARPVVQERIRTVDYSSGMMASNLISAPMPDYPTLARLTHVSGEVVIQAVVAKNGTVMATHVMRGNRLLRGAAQDAVKRWRFKPYMMDGHPVEMSTIVTVRFKPPS